MTEWLPFVKEVGLPVALVALFLFFLWKGFWPFMVKQIDEAREARKEDQQAFLSALKERDQITREQTDAIRHLAQRIDDTTRRV